MLLIAAAAAVAAGAALQAAIGFGFALVAAPLLFAALGPEEAVGSLIVLGLEVNLLTLLGERRRPAPRWDAVRAIVAWSLPGSLVGVALLRSLDALALQLLVTAGVLAALAVQLRGARGSDPPSLAGFAADSRAGGGGSDPPPPAAPARLGAGSLAAAGLASGALNTSTSTGGPPVVLALLGRGLAPGTVRDTLTACFVGFAPVGVLALVVTGTGEAMPDAGTVAVLVPLAALGHLAGRRVFARLAGGRRYERAVALVLVVTAGAGLATVLM